MHCNAGTRRIIQVRTLKNYDGVWFNGDTTMNILSLARIKERYPIKYDSTVGNQFVIIQTDKEVIFKQIILDLYYHNTANRAIVMVNIITYTNEGLTQ
jgi:hypothetical protein